ncbi:MAG: hypothetical protein CMI03_16525 [Oceanospirillaceae bacterium]|uniref:hypothetical protein n=1 Tax=unclassified Thalassolituus TaxID=2624967 RepID=UPI000C606D1D|nr:MULTISPECIES: hypothetical protein [unclassified Thalassolituus]MBL33269.1 hypothetical protein [Oceanospirillaceae bacterium]MBS54347.1 hypothetical protein [Oceanospirillaceae bacterium]|tara:strand:- start:6845 stop:7087 length:243 start_codon:yes stop_codon:yes gene_type:complete
MMYADIIDAEDVYEALKELGIKVSCDADMTAAINQWLTSCSFSERANLMALFDILMEQKTLMLPDVYQQVNSTYHAIAAA